ncbi:MAG: aminotransferase class I/II-fold pyridoxal phosphate-dependent enzyme [Alphaproteobacteria bacterium]|nr:aminotransferase class I/II-fold pyridoxal phosphate-dependent enzyme [Alphaproteobacteria bacterium]
MLNERLDLLADYPFSRLANLIAGLSPRSNETPVVMSVGDPQHQPPAFATEILGANADKWNAYPPLQGTAELRQAIVGWLERRYRLAGGTIDFETQIAPVAGTREGLFIVALLAVSRAKNGATPVALMPNPFYQVYYGAAVMAGAEPVFLTTTRETGFLPDLDAIPADTLARTAIFYLCTPGNPQGAIATREYIAKAIGLAREHDFLLVLDECYAELYYGDAPPPGGTEVAHAMGRGPKGHPLDNVVCMHTLSKRSSAAGMRSGFALGSPATIQALNRLRSYSCAATPIPIQMASAALWRDEAHAIQTRALYKAKFESARRHLGGMAGFRAPEGGMFLWLDVGDGEVATKKLWAETGIKVLPGAYLTKNERDGSNTGKPFVRVALVHDLETVDRALARIAKVL